MDHFLFTSIRLDSSSNLKLAVVLMDHPHVSHRKNDDGYTSNFHGAVPKASRKSYTREVKFQVIDYYLCHCKVLFCQQEVYLALV